MKQKTKIMGGYLIRYTVVHVIMYLIVGLLFMNLMNYNDAFLNDQAFANFRPIDSPIVRAAILFQILRGLMFALILYPFRNTIINSKYGWLMLFFVLFGLTSIGTIEPTPGSIEGFIYTNNSLKAHFIGMPEVITQSMSFSVLFWLWERKKIVIKKLKS